MKLPNRISVLLPLTFLIASIFLLVFLHMQTYVSINEDNFTIQIGLSPSYNIASQEILVSWDVEGIESIYFNDQGVIGHDQRLLSAAYCQPISFDIITADSSAHHIILTPFIWTSPLHFIILSLSVFLLVTVIAGLFPIPILQNTVNRILEIREIRREDYWQYNGVIWLRCVLIITILFFCNPLVVTSCLSAQHSAELPFATIPFILPGIISIIVLLLSIFKPQILLSITNIVKRFLPYPIIILSVFLYWFFSFDSTIHLPDVFRLPSRILIFTIGVIILFVYQNESKIAFVVHLPVSKSRRRLLLLLVAILWVFIYRTAWVSIFQNYFLQTTLAFGLFIIPGYLLAVILISDKKRWTRLVTLGFALSIFMVIIIAIVSIILGLSATVFQWLFIIAGGLMLLYILQNRSTVNISFSKVTSFSLFETLFLAFCLVSLVLLVLMMRDLVPLDSDIHSYNAIITQFAQSSHLSLEDPYLGTNNLMKPRLWLIAWPVSQSLIVAFSNLNILLIFQNFNLLLALLVLIAVYDLLCRFEIPWKLALFSVFVITFAVLTQLSDIRTIGSMFLYRLGQDKVMTAWLLTPIVIHSVYDYLQYGTLRYVFLFLIVTLVIVFTHATIFFYIAMIIGIVVVLYVLLQSQKWHHILIFATILGICALIPFALREIGYDTYVFDVTDSLEIKESRGIDQIVFSDEGVLYGMNPQFREGLVFVIAYISTGIALLRLKSFPLGYYIIAGTVVLLSSSNPITAPLIAKFITPFQLWRAPWLIPFGINGVAVLQFLYFNTDMVPLAIKRLIMLILATGAIIAMTGIVDNDINNRKFLKPYINTYSKFQPEYEELIEIADFIRADTDQNLIRVFVDRQLMYPLPSVDSDIHTIIWRSQSQAGLSNEEQLERESDYDRFSANDLTLSEFHNLLDKYNIHYIIMARNFENKLNSFLENSPRIAQHKEFGSIDVWVVTSIPSPK